jgi:hypothetical protein
MREAPKGCAKAITTDVAGCQDVSLFVALPVSLCFFNVSVMQHMLHILDFSPGPERFRLTTINFTPRLPRYALCSMILQHSLHAVLRGLCD